ncbi:MAG: J domain-containing protein [Ruminococcus sp.]|nr:J domain-containing protein [Ruminococcus sp.]
MSDPYKILGVKPDANDNEIREAYRKLAAKYHPDVQGQGPLSDIAKTKMSELNEAFDRIMDIRRGSGIPTEEYTQQCHGGNQLFAEIRRQIQLGNLSVADSMLEKIETDRDAEWSFLKGSVCYARGWLNDAYHYFSNATKLNPENSEYRAAFSRMQASKNGNMNGNPDNPYRENPSICGGCSPCDLCTDLICADCCCECLGGDLIPCC